MIGSLFSKIKCPYCHESFGSRSMHYFCRECEKKKAGSGRKDSNEIARIGWWPFVRGPRPVRCKTCENSNPKPVCQKCGRDIPVSMGTWGVNLFFAAMGSPKTGKTTFLRILNQQIGYISKPFKWAQSIKGDSTREWERESAKEIEYGTPPRKTEADGGKASIEPNLYALEEPNKGLIYAFYDPAGEYMYSRDSMEENLKYIKNLDGFIFLVNPLSLPKVREKMGKIQNTAEEYSRIKETLDRIEETCGVDSRAIRKKCVAVCLTRSDLLKELLPPALMTDGRHNGYFNIKDHIETSREVGDLLEDWLDPSIRNRLAKYRDYGFFAFSALGGDPGDDAKLRHTPQPIRVADPFLWLLWKNGFIKGKK